MHPNGRSTVGLLLTAPADGGHYTLEHPFVRREVERISAVLGLGCAVGQGFVFARPMPAAELEGALPPLPEVSTTHYATDIARITAVI